MVFKSNLTIAKLEQYSFNVYKSILKVKGNYNVSPAIRISLIQSDEWWVKRARPQLSTLGPALVLPQSMLQAYWTVKYVKYAWLFQSNFSLCHACKKVFSWVFFSGLRCTGHTGWLPDHCSLSELYHLPLTLTRAGPGQTIGGPVKVIRPGRCQHFTTLGLRPYVSAIDISHSNTL